jgi:hypothetical protein
MFFTITGKYEKVPGVTAGNSHPTLSHLRVGEKRDRRKMDSGGGFLLRRQ